MLARSISIDIRTGRVRVLVRVRYARSGGFFTPPGRKNRHKKIKF